MLLLFAAPLVAFLFSARVACPSPRGASLRRSGPHLFCFAVSPRCPLFQRVSLLGVVLASWCPPTALLLRFFSLVLRSHFGPQRLFGNCSISTVAMPDSFDTSDEEDPPGVENMWNPALDHYTWGRLLVHMMITLSAACMLAGVTAPISRESTCECLRGDSLHGGRCE